MHTLVKKWLTQDELVAIDPIVEAEGWTPLPRAAIAVAIFDEDGVVGFHVLQLRPHAEPLWVRPDMRGTDVAIQLTTEMEQLLTDTNTQGFIVVADSPEAVKLCEKFGMTRVDSPVYIR